MLSYTSAVTIALDASPLTVSTGGVGRYTLELARALATEYPDDQYWLLSDQPFRSPQGPANLDAGDDVLNVGLNRAVALIADKKANHGRGRFRADPGRSLGDHPDKGGPVVVKNGRYGPYVSHDGVNANLPSDLTTDSITLEQALPLLDARAARGTGTRKKGLAKKPAAKKAGAAKKPAEKEES